MATQLPTTVDTVKTVSAEAVKTVEATVKAPVEAVAKTAAQVVEAVKPVTEPVVAAVKAPVAAAKTVAKIVTAKAAPVKKVVAKKVAARKAAAKTVVAKAVKPVAAPKPLIVKAAKAVVTAAAKVATPAKKEWTIMATKFETPKMFTEINDRAKVAVEKSQKFAAEFGDFNKGNIEAIVESSKIAAKGLETLGQDAADYTRKSFEGATATIKSLASVKSPTDFFKLQSDYARSAFDAAVAQTSKNTEALIKLSSDAAQPISSRFAVAVEKVKAAA